MIPVHTRRCIPLCFMLSLLVFGFTAAAYAMEDPRPLPDYRARLLGSDQKVAFTDFPGKVILINTWATWCPPCRKEMPDFEKIHKRYHNEGLVVIGVNIDEGQVDAAVAEFVEGLGVSFATWRDPHNRFSKRFRSLAVPETFLVDRNGMIIRHWRGPIDPNADENLSVIKTALESGPAAHVAPVTAAATPRRGRRLAEQRGCLTCHSTDGSPGAGPTWTGIAGAEVSLADGRRVARNRDYLTRAIADPDAEIVAGYAEGVMTGAIPGKRLTESEVEALVLYLESLSN
jgi:thiol-disulfide isomerase/thioredoxin/cytochrome c551/c552